MASLRIVFVMPFFAWRLGGSVQQARLTAKELVRAGHRVTVLTTDLGVGEGDAESGDYEVRRAAATGWSARPPYAAPRELLHWLDELLPATDVVTTQVGLTWLNVAAERRAAASGVPFVYCAQGALSPERLAQKRWQKKCFLRLWERPLLRRVAGVQALSATEACDLVRQGAPRQRVTIVPNGIDPAAWCNGDAAAARARLGLARERLIVFLGRLAPEKGLDLMLAAAAPVLKVQPSLRLVLAGPDGGELASLQTLASRLGVAASVCWPGAIEPPHRADLFAAAAVFAHTSRAEGQPLSVIEAAAAGCPLWLTTGCNLPEVATSGAGTVDPPHADALTASLLRLLASERGETWRAAAQRMVRESFAVAATAARLEALYRQLAGEAARARPRTS